MDEMFEHVMQIVHQYPDFAAAVVGVFLSMVATQFFKNFLPDTWTDQRYRRWTQLMGFATGWFFTHGAWVLFDPTSSHFEKVYASMGCGFASPALYSFLSAWLSAKFPWFERTFSGRPQGQSDGKSVGTDGSGNAPKAV